MRAESLLAGILLPDTVFQQEWMWYLGAFVAFNTIVFVGLSIGKFVPWPPQPSRALLDEWRNRASRQGSPRHGGDPQEGQSRPPH